MNRNQSRSLIVLLAFAGVASQAVSQAASPSSSSGSVGTGGSLGIIAGPAVLTVALFCYCCCSSLQILSGDTFFSRNRQNAPAAGASIAVGRSAHAFNNPGAVGRTGAAAGASL